jgi:hypothetical protein
MAKGDVIKQSRELIEGVRELLSLSSTAAAAALLRHFKVTNSTLCVCNCVLCTVYCVLCTVY